MEQNTYRELRSYVKTIDESYPEPKVAADMRTFWFAFVMTLFFVVLLLIPHAS